MKERFTVGQLCRDRVVGDQTSRYGDTPRHWNTRHQLASPRCGATIKLWKPGDIKHNHYSRPFVLSTGPEGRVFLSGRGTRATMHFIDVCS